MRHSTKGDDRRWSARGLAWLAGALLAVCMAVLLAPASVQAGTITIIDGPDTPPVDGVYTDGYIQAQLAASSFTITTTSVIAGPDEIRVLPGVTITWSSGNMLTLDAGSSVIISGTIQHDGPTNGAGGLRLLAPAGTVTVGQGTQTAGVAAGSRFGLTRVHAASLVLNGGSTGVDPFALLGFRAVDKGAAYTVTGAISVTVSQNVAATAGTTDYAFVQIGHGGADTDTANDSTASGSFRGAIDVDAGKDVTFQGGGDVAYAQLGNGGGGANGDHSGGHTLSAGGDVTFHGGVGSYSYTQLGNGGNGAEGNHSGDHTLDAGGDVTFQGGDGGVSFSQLGNGGYNAYGSHSGGHSLSAGGNVTFLGGSARYTYAQLGNGGLSAAGSHSGDHRLAAGGDVTFQAGDYGDSFSQLGNGGYWTNGNHSGSHTLSAGGNVTFQGDAALGYAQLGNGGYWADGNHSGGHTLSAGGDVTFQAGSDLAYAQLGNGGAGANANLSGSLALTNAGSLTVTAGSGYGAYAMLGHGSAPDFQTWGSRAGDIALRVGETAVFSGSQVGHLTANGVLSVTQGNTYVGVSQNHPFDDGTGQLLVTGVTTTSFTSAPADNGGELRFYLPREDSQQTPTNATFNGETFATASTIPPAQLAGVALFGAGLYIPDYSFYLGGQPPDVAVTKSVTPTDTVQAGATLTYTISFSNTGTGAATGVVVSDSLPTVVTDTVVTLSPDSGVVITQTGAAPVLVWAVSDLAPGQGGVIELAVTVQPVAEVGSVITNTVIIGATGDTNGENNTAAVSNEVIAPDESANVYLPVLQR